PGAGCRRSSTRSSSRRQPEGRCRDVFPDAPRPRRSPPARPPRVGARDWYNERRMAQPLDPDRYRTVFGHFATGVAVITVAGPGGEGGLTANAVCSVSLDPLLALVCFEQRARTLPLVRDTGRFAVNVLRAGAEDVARVFASKAPEGEKLRTVPHRLEAGMPILDAALAWVVCDVR